MQCAPLEFHRIIPHKDVRKLVWRHLTKHDREMVRCAQNGQRVPELEVDFAEHCAELGYVGLLEWTRAHGSLKFEAHLCVAAARGGQLDTLKWLRSCDPPCPWDEWTSASAAMIACLPTLEWLRACDPPCPWSERSCARAARGGHVTVLQWLRSCDPPCAWNDDTCSGAARNGHLSLLQWRARQLHHVHRAIGPARMQQAVGICGCFSGCARVILLVRGMCLCVSGRRRMATCMSCYGREPMMHQWERNESCCLVQQQSCERQHPSGPPSAFRMLSGRNASL